MVIVKVENSSIVTMNDDSKNDARMNVLYSPFRKREVNPQDWESKMSFWKNSITNWCLDCNNPVFTLAKLQSVFTRNGRPASCLATVLDTMIRNSEIICLQDLLNKNICSQSWSSWAVDCFVRTPITWSFMKLKESLVTQPECDFDKEYVHLAVLKKHSELLKASNEKSTKTILSLDEIKTLLGLKDDLSTKVTLHWLQLQGQVAVTTINKKTIVKLLIGSEQGKSFTEADLGLYQLQQNERALVQMLEQLEKEKQEAELEARNYLKKGMRQVAKSCLRKKRELEKCMDKRSSALENVQVLLSRVKDAESDGEIIESYRMGLSALRATFKEAGLSEDSVGDTMDQVKEVLEVHEEIQSALSEPMAASVDEDLEKELADILSGSVPEFFPDKEHPVQNKNTQNDLPDLPEPPSSSPTSSLTKTTTRAALLL